MLNAVPLEILNLIFTYVDNDVLISLSSTSRYINACVIPLLYQHTDLDIWLTGDLTGSHSPPLAALRGLAANTQGQCQHIKRLTIRSKRWPLVHSLHDRELFKSLGGVLKEGIILQNSTIWMIEGLLETALRNMSSLLHLDWRAGFSRPDAVLPILGNHLHSLNCDALWLYKISTADRKPSIPELSSLTSLCVSGMVESQTLSLFSEVLSKCGSSLRYLKLQSIPPRWPLDLPAQPQDKLLISQLEHLSTPGELIKLESLELLLLDIGGGDWYKLFDFQSLTTLTLIGKEQSIDDDTFFNYLLELRVPLRRLYTNMVSHSMVRYISSSSHLEEFIFPAEWLQLTEAPPDLSGHFGSLKSLFLEDLIPPTLRGDRAFEYLRLIISNCRVLEQLAFNINALDTSEVWKILSSSPTLKHLFFLICRDPLWDLQVPASHMLRDLLVYYFYSQPSPFFERLELFSCFQSLWSFEPIALTADEEEELEYELTYEDISDDELRDLGIDVPDRAAAPPSPPPESPMNLEETHDNKEDEDEEETDLGFGLCGLPAAASEPYPPEPKYEYHGPPRPTPFLMQDGTILVTRRLLDEPYCYSWERAISGYSSIPMRVSWDEYADDRFVCAVRDFVGRYAWTNPEMEMETPERDVDWEENDEGWDCFLAKELAGAKVTVG